MQRAWRATLIGSIAPSRVWRARGEICASGTSTVRTCKVRSRDSCAVSQPLYPAGLRDPASASLLDCSPPGGHARSADRLPRDSACNRRRTSKRPCVTASSYTSGDSSGSSRTMASREPWAAFTSRRTAERVGLAHVLASCALPLAFPSCPSRASTSEMAPCTSLHR